MTLSDWLEELWEKRAPLLITFTAYLAVAQIAHYLYAGLDTAPAVVLSPVGISLAAYILWGYAMWPAVALGALVSGVLTGVPPLILVSLIIGNVLQAVVGLYVLRRAHFERLFLTLQDMFAMIFTAMVTTLIVPTLELWATLLYNSFYGTNLPVHLFNSWLGGALSTLVMTPFLIRWLMRPMSPRDTPQYLEIAGSMTLVIVSSILLFGTPHGSIFGLSLIYPLFAGLFWMAFRGGVRFMTLELFVMATISLAGVIWGEGAAPQGTLSERIANVQTLDLFLVFFFFIITLLEKQRAGATRRLSQHAAKLQEALERIRTADEAKNEFIALLGHELRNPLAALLSSTEVLSISDLKEEERQEFLAGMNERIRAMAHLLDDILDISRITQRKFALRKELVNAADVAKRAGAAVAPIMEKNRHTFILDFPPQGLMLNADPTRLEQVMVNILHNAAKYTPPCGRIDFKGYAQEGVVIISIKDTGIGIAPSMMERIFQPFVQVNPKLNRAGGIGIGLSLTKGLVELHEGALSVKSQEGAGSEFIVQLPRVEAAPQELPAEERPQPGQKTGPLKILVVDDNEEAVYGLARLLSMHGGHQTRILHDGAQVIDVVAEYMPDVIILDIGLPDIDGHTLARMLRERNVPTPLIALSGYGQAEDKKRAKGAGFDYHLTKPVGFKEVEELLKRITEK